jgi:hypothetical protein
MAVDDNPRIGGARAAAERPLKVAGTPNSMPWQKSLVHGMRQSVRDSVIIDYRTENATPPIVSSGPISFRCRRRLLSSIRDVLPPDGGESATGVASYNSHLQ